MVADLFLQLAMRKYHTYVFLPYCTSNAVQSQMLLLYVKRRTWSDAPTLRQAPHSAKCSNRTSNVVHVCPPRPPRQAEPNRSKTESKPDRHRIETDVKPNRNLRKRNRSKTEPKPNRSRTKIADITWTQGNSRQPHASRETSPKSRKIIQNTPPKSDRGIGGSGGET